MFENALKAKDFFPANYTLLDVWPMPAACFLATGEILYANQLYAENIQQDLSALILQKLQENNAENIELEPFGYTEQDKHFLLTLKVHVNPEGQTQSILVCGTDITHLRIKEQYLLRHNQELQKMVEIDHLTGVYNKRSFDLHLPEWQHRLDDGELQQCSVIMLDLDNFKRINDEYGHAAGDRVLRLTATLLCDVLKMYSDSLLFRIGGEEFAIVLPHKNLEQACILGQRCCDAVAASSSHLTGIFQLTLSCGVASYMQYQRLNEVLQQADQALYFAKNNDKNCTGFYQQGKMQVFRTLL